MTYKTGGYYDGEWKDDAKSGYGKYLQANGSFYEGHYLNNLRHG